MPTRIGPHPPRLAAGDELVLGRYRLGRALGSGGFGAVYAARDERLDRDVAVKLLPRERIVGGRFEREARAAARLSHPAIVTLFEAAVDDDGAYLVSELVRGRTLRQLLDGGRLSDRDIVRIAISVCDALIHAHAHGVIHRDVKPANILVATGGKSVKLTDFGVARVVGGDTLTRTGDVIGTASYMAPEQAEGRDAGAEADLYALALVIYEALTGVNPIRGLRSGRHHNRLGTYLPPLRRQRRDLPGQLGVGIDRALRPRPRERGTVEELRAALSASLEQASARTGIVTAGWGSSAVPEEDELGPEWRDAEPNEDPRSTPWSAAGTPAGSTSLPVRALGATTAAATAAYATVHLTGTPPPAVAALIAATGGLVAPRLTAGLGTAALAATAAFQGHPGGALLLLGVVAVSALLLPRRGPLWTLPAVALMLGSVGLPALWPVLVVRLRAGWGQRGVLAAAGALWIAAAAVPERTAVARLPSLLLRSGLPVTATVWAAVALALPLAARGRSPARHLAVAILTGAVLAAATPAAVPGAVVAALIVAAPAARGGGAQPEVP